MIRPLQRRERLLFNTVKNALEYAAVRIVLIYMLYIFPARFLHLGRAAIKFGADNQSDIE